MNHPVTNFEIAGKYGAELSKFYGNVFGWKIQNYPGGFYCIPDGDNGIQGNIQPTSNGSLSSNYVAIFVPVANLEDAHKKVVTLGGQEVVPPTLISDEMGSYMICSDPCGNYVGMYEVGKREK